MFYIIYYAVLLLYVNSLYFDIHLDPVWNGKNAQFFNGIWNTLCCAKVLACRRPIAVFYAFWDKNAVKFNAYLLCLACPSYLSLFDISVVITVLGFQHRGPSQFPGSHPVSLNRYNLATYLLTIIIYIECFLFYFIH